MEPCIFCQIIGGEIPCHKVYEDESTFAFLDRHPINPGHILVVPKQHSPTFYEMDDADYAALMRTVKLLASRVDSALAPKKVGLIVAGWDVSHTHVHVVPMMDYNDITSKSILEGKCGQPSAEELSHVADMLIMKAQ